MKLERIDSPQIYSRGDYDEEDFSEWDFKRLEERGVVDAIYWYSTGNYCGSGQIIAKMNDGRFVLHDCSHCSCYGPTEEFDGKPIYESLDELESKCSADLLDNHLAELIAAWRARA